MMNDIRCFSPLPLVLFLSLFLSPSFAAFEDFMPYNPMKGNDFMPDNPMKENAYMPNNPMKGSAFMPQNPFMPQNSMAEGSPFEQYMPNNPKKASSPFQNRMPLPHDPKGESLPPMPQEPREESLPPSADGPPKEENIVQHVQVQGTSQKKSSLNSSFQGSFSEVFAFGDSFTDAGNAQMMGGLSKEASQNAQYDATGSGKGANRLCDGRLVVDFIADSLGIKSLPPYQSAKADFSSGVNFALAGWSSLSANALAKAGNAMWQGAQKNMQVQMDWFKKYCQEKICKGMSPEACKSKFDKGLFWVGEIGINDYTRTIGATAAGGPNPSYRAIAESSVAYSMNLVTTLMESGAKYMVVQGLPPVGCFPLYASVCPFNLLDNQGCSKLVNTAIMIHNQMLQRRLEAFRKQYTNCTIVYADYWNAYLTILNNPQKFQFEEPRKACCGASGPNNKLNFNPEKLCGSPGTNACKDPSKYINWDGIHPTEAMNYHVTDLLLNKGLCQPSFDELVKKKKSCE